TREATGHLCKRGEGRYNHARPPAGSAFAARRARGVCAVATGGRPGCLIRHTPPRAAPPATRFPGSPRSGRDQRRDRDRRTSRTEPVRMERSPRGREGASALYFFLQPSERSVPPMATVATTPRHLNATVLLGRGLTPG